MNDDTLALGSLGINKEKDIEVKSNTLALEYLDVSNEKVIEKVPFNHVE